VIFALRALMVSLAFFAIIYSVLSILLVVAWRGLGLLQLEKRIGAHGLFTLRVSPFLLSVAISIFLTLPSFFLLESRSLDEDMGTFLLSLCAVVILGAGIYRVLSVEARTRRIVSACLGGAAKMEGDRTAAEIVLPESITPLMLVGIRVPRILISASACNVLSEHELRAAVRHETAHLRSQDNLKKAILSCLPFPGMASLEETWQEASEFAADDGAVSSRDEALDLAAALIKLARHFPSEPMPVLATGLVSTVGSISTRVERLVAWQESSGASRYSWRYAMAVGFMACFVLAAKLGSALVLVHSLTERLVP